MNTNLKRRARKLFFIALAIFSVLFVCRLAYGYYYPGVMANFDNGSDDTDVSYSRKNYASEKISKESKVDMQALEVPAGSKMDASPSSNTQKYEKVATVRSKTNQYEEDEKSINNKIKGFGGVIQYEQNRGNKGNRSLNLVIGIAPEKFDSFCLEIQKIGKIVSKQVTKTDMTNEYLQLNAKKVSLEKVRNSLLELKDRQGRIDEYVQLENRILEIEGELQDLGVELGNFDEENEFCTVKFYLVEQGEKKAGIGLVQRFKVAFEWTAKYTLVLYGVLTFALLGAYLLLLVIEKLRILSRIVNLFKENTEK